MLTLTMTALYAFWDFTLPGEFTVAILYASSVVAAGWARSRMFLWLIVLLSVALTYAGLAFGPSPPDGLLGAFYINRSFVAFGLFIIGAIVHQRMDAVEQAEKARDDQLSQNEKLLEAHQELRRTKDELEDRVRHEVAHRLEIERSLQQAQKMEAIGQLAGGIAHDFNNVLTTVIANLELIRARCLDSDPARRLADNALLGAKQGASFTKQLLGFARRHPMVPELAGMDRILTEIVTLAGPVMPPKIELCTETSAGIGEIFVDCAQLESALLNLVINARDAMPDGGRITLCAENISVEKSTVDFGSGDYVHLSVIDTGCGMTPEVMARAFEPMFTTKSAGKGTGLGLAMVYAFAKQCGGVARIESAAGRGTTVHLYLPRANLQA
ncbi:MAG TPA: ATP-binding protein [Micropepsaceae bacterium]|nr:ATP-binding protein [Micropepsaceae bacterium]